MKFGDVITAVAAVVVLFFIISFVIGLPLNVSASVASSDWAGYVQSIVSIFVSAVIVGYIFARRIWSENGLEAITKISLLGAVFTMLYVSNFSGLPAWGPSISQAISNAFPNATFSAAQLLNLETKVLGNLVFQNSAIALVTGFAGLYVGSKLKKTPKS